MLTLIVSTIRWDGLWAQRFSAGIGSGLIISQMDGDGYTGYDKIGKRIGLRGQAYINETMDFIIELNWEEKGSRIETDLVLSGGEKNRTIHLVYAEIPMLLRLFSKKRNGLFGEIGASISYLVKNRFKVDGDGSLDKFEQLAADFNRSEWNAVLGGGYEFNSHFGILFRTTIGFQYLYRNQEAIEAWQTQVRLKEGEPEPILQLRNYLVSVGMYYII